MIFPRVGKRGVDIGALFNVGIPFKLILRKKIREQCFICLHYYWDTLFKAKYDIRVDILDDLLVVNEIKTYVSSHDNQDHHLFTS